MQTRTTCWQQTLRVLHISLENLLPKSVHIPGVLIATHRRGTIHFLKALWPTGFAL